MVSSDNKNEPILMDGCHRIQKRKVEKVEILKGMRAALCKQ